MSFNYFGGFSAISSLFGGSSGSIYQSLGDYSSIRTGSYKRLLNSYYSTVRNNGKTNTDKNSGKSDRVQNLYNDKLQNLYQEVYGVNRKVSAVKGEADELTASAKALTAKGDQSLFEMKEFTAVDENGVKTTTKGYDIDAIAKAVKGFVSEYNDVISAGTYSKDSNVSRNTSYMARQTKIYERSLEEVGISVGKDNTLSVDETKLKSANVDTLKRVFNGDHSFAAQTANRSGSISQSALRAATSATTYGRNGAYNMYNNYLNAYNWYF